MYQVNALLQLFVYFRQQSIHSIQFDKIDHKQKTTMHLLRMVYNILSTSCHM